MKVGFKFYLDVCGAGYNINEKNRDKVKRTEQTAFLKSNAISYQKRK